MEHDETLVCGTVDTADLKEKGAGDTRSRLTKNLTWEYMENYKSNILCK